MSIARLQTLDAIRSVILGKDAEFEARHPRDDDGKFAEKGTAGAAAGNPAPGLALKGKTAYLNGKPLKEHTLDEVAPQIVFLRSSEDNALFGKGFTLVYFMDSPESAKNMAQGKIPYMLMPEGGLSWRMNQRTDPVTQMWLKRKQQPGQEHILGMISGVTDDKELFVDVASVRKEWRRNGIADFMVKRMQASFPGAKLAFSDATADGKQFIRHLGGRAPNDTDIKPNKVLRLIKPS